MKQILWFRRDLRISDNAILSSAKGEVLAIFIFDENILSKLERSDKRVTFIYKSVLQLKEKLKSIGLDLAIFYGNPTDIFKELVKYKFDEVLCSVDFDYYSKKRDSQIEKIIPMKRYCDSFILNPWEHLKADNTPYKKFTPFYKSLSFIHESNHLEEFEIKNKLTKIEFDYNSIPSLNDLGFKEEKLEKFLYKSADKLIIDFLKNIEVYEKDRDFFFKDVTSKLSVHLRFGLISAKEIFNKIKSFKNYNNSFFIRELFWREFYNYILFHFPKSQFENFNGMDISWNENEDDFYKWCTGNTGIPIIDASMREFNKTGMMHNRLRMVVASFLCKNLLINWKKGERYFASKLLDYEASSNIGSWQWAASTGADSVPYFRIFNPYLQSEKFDKEAIFIKSVIPEYKDINPKLIHKENKTSKAMLSIEFSRNRALETFKRARNEKV